MRTGCVWVQVGASSFAPRRTRSPAVAELEQSAKRRQQTNTGKILGGTPKMREAGQFDGCG